MADHSTSRLWLMRAAFVGIALVTLLYHLLPLDLSPRRWAGPDLIMAIAFAWVLRRPEYVPALSIGIVFFVADLLYLNPPGLLAALVVIACESLKSRARSLRQQPFMVEWFNVSVTIVGLTLIYRAVLAILLIPQASLLLSATQAIATIAIYPVVVFVSRNLLGIHKSTLGEVNALGQRL